MRFKLGTDDINFSHGSYLGYGDYVVCDLEMNCNRISVIPSDGVGCPQIYKAIDDFEQIFEINDIEPLRFNALNVKGLYIDWDKEQCIFGLEATFEEN